LVAEAATLIERLATWGPVVILSDGDVVFQPRKIERSGLGDAVEGRVLIYIHKEQELADVEQRYPARHYVLIDDKLRILAAVKKVWGKRVTTVWPRQGHYALDPEVLTQYPPADVAVERISDLLQTDRAAALGTPVDSPGGRGIMSVAHHWLAAIRLGRAGENRAVMSTLPGVTRLAASGSARRFSVSEYHQMIQSGILDEDDDVGLLDGYGAEVPRSLPMTERSRQCARITALLPAGWDIRVDPPSTGRVSEPDLAIVRGTFRTYFTATLARQTWG
jgi:hypothetical protein